MSFNPVEPSSGAPTEQAVRVGDVAFRVRAAAERRPYWNRVTAGGWEAQTFRVLRRFLRPEADAIDIGAWIGPTALYAAHFAQRVHAVEPDAAAHAELAANLAANPELAGHIQPHACCIAREPGPVTLYAGGMYYSAASRFRGSR